jgi:NAD(P)-dependent dehydrogenase (short-subunit alcohol dehydrogenase family)
VTSAMSNDLDPGGRVAVVTGGGSGLGRVVAHALVADGYRVAVLGRTRDTLEETATSSARPDRVLVAPADVSTAADVDAAFQRVRDTWGRVDVLVNNAGTFGPNGDPDEIEPEDWSRTIGVNLTGTFLCARAAFAAMKAQRPQGGRIINNGSISAYAPRPGSAAYTASKHAVAGLTKSLSLDGRPYGIACGQIDIGNAATEMTSAMGGGVRQADGSVRPEPTFDPVHVGEAVLQMANLPPDVNVQSMTILATTMPFIGRG